jgi:hypothetical protein
METRKRTCEAILIPEGKVVTSVAGRARAVPTERRPDLTLGNNFIARRTTSLPTQQLFPSCLSRYRCVSLLECSMNLAELPLRALVSRPVKKVRFSPDTKDNEAKSATSAEITHADIIEVGPRDSSCDSLPSFCLPISLLLFSFVRRISQYIQLRSRLSPSQPFLIFLLLLACSLLLFSLESSVEAQRQTMDDLS